MKPRFDPILESMYMEMPVDGTTIAASFFDSKGVLTYPWRREVEAIAGPERHTLRAESRSWPLPGKRIAAAARVLSDFDLTLSRKGINRTVDHYLLSEVNHSYLIRVGRLSIDRLAAVIGIAASVTNTPPVSDLDWDLVAASEIFLSLLMEYEIPFDGRTIEDAGAECVGIAWGLYCVPEKWNDEAINRAIGLERMV